MMNNAQIDSVTIELIKVTVILSPNIWDQCAQFLARLLTDTKKIVKHSMILIAQLKIVTIGPT
jgi:hypothetical protein